MIFHVAAVLRGCASLGMTDKHALPQEGTGFMKRVIQPTDKTLFFIATISNQTSCVCVGV